MRPLLRYHGGKWRLAPWILSHVPPHRVYTEAFGGGASVLIRKARAHAEIYNDLDDEIVNVFRVMRAHGGALEAALRLTPFARAEFRRAYEPTDEPIERARRTIVRSFMGFGSAATTRSHVTGFRANSHRSGTTPAQDWWHYPDHLPTLIERLRGVVLECRPAVEVLLAHDGPATVHYVDPPYVHGTRNFRWRNTAYAHEMTDADHRALAEVLRELRGMVVLSGYACDLYDRELYADWRRVECQTIKSTNRASAQSVEVLWLNAAAVRRLSGVGRQRSLFAQEASA